MWDTSYPVKQEVSEIPCMVQIKRVYIHTCKLIDRSAKEFTILSRQNLLIQVGLWPWTFNCRISMCTSTPHDILTIKQFTLYYYNFVLFRVPDWFIVFMWFNHKKLADLLFPRIEHYRPHYTKNWKLNDLGACLHCANYNALHH
jgi:hypothetical protein